MIEVKKKPSRPIGKSGYDAFGNQPYFPDEGDRLRAIANIGREDVMVEGLTPIDRGVRVLGASSDHLLLDVTDAEVPVAVGGRVAFRMGYGAMLLAMTSEYVEKVPMHDVEIAPRRRMVQIVADPGAAVVLARQRVGARLEAIDYDVVTPGDDARLPAGLLRLSAGEDRGVALPALAATVRETHSLGLIRFDSKACLGAERAADGSVAPDSVLSQALGLMDGEGALQPQLSPENVVLVGLREASTAEAAVLKASRVTVMTMADIDALGMGEVMRQALRIAANGTTGFHVSYSPEVTEIPGWIEGSGGMTVRETHLAMEAVALAGGMLSMDVSGLTATLDERVAAETVSFVMSSFGKRIL
ncbi:arginase family protein [Mesorhizobium marinum]|uniref:arginase family protein n=1 Tax=Mesorhizobium marinum TaxID=3228790 RepID=UPI003467A725